MSLDDLAQFWIGKKYSNDCSTDIWYLKKIRRLIGSRMIESTAYYNKKLLTLLYLNSIQNKSGNWNIWFLISLSFWPKLILLSGKHSDIQEQKLIVQISIKTWKAFFQRIFYVRTIQHKLLMSRLQKNKLKRNDFTPCKIHLLLFTGCWKEFKDFDYVCEESNLSVIKGGLKKEVIVSTPLSSSVV